MTTATLESRFDALESARMNTERLRENADYGDREGQLHPDSIEMLKSSGMLSLWRPKSLGGHECDPVEYVTAVEEIATADTAAAWLMHGTPGSWFDIRAATDEFLEEVVNSAKVPVLAGTFNRPMTATEVDGGYRVTGATPFASGCKFADWIGHTVLAGDRLLLLYHPRGALEIREDWNSLGMRGTCSNTIVAEDVFVPAHRVFDLIHPRPLNGHFQGPLYHMPPLVIPSAISASMLGVLRVCLEALQELAERKTPFGAASSLKHRVLAQHHFGEASAVYRAARSFIHATLYDAYERAKKERPFDVRARADLLLAYAFTQQQCVEAVRRVFRAAGTTGIFKGHPLERALRDAEVMSHHVFGAESRYANYAEAYWGAEISFPMLAME